MPSAHQHRPIRIVDARTSMEHLITHESAMTASTLRWWQLWNLGTVTTDMTGSATRDAQAWMRGDWTPDQTS
jgi:hypothetical protein